MLTFINSSQLIYFVQNLPSTSLSSIWTSINFGPLQCCQSVVPEIEAPGRSASWCWGTPLFSSFLSVIRLISHTSEMVVTQLDVSTERCQITTRSLFLRWYLVCCSERLLWLHKVPLRVLVLTTCPLGSPLDLPCSWGLPLVRLI